MVCMSFFMLCKFSRSFLKFSLSHYVRASLQQFSDLYIWQIACLYLISLFPEIYPVPSFRVFFFCFVFFSFLSLHFGYLFVFVSMFWVELLCLPILVGWPLRRGVLWGPVVEFPWLPELGAHECPLGVLHAPSCCNCVLICIDLFVHGIAPQIGWLWALTNTSV